MTEHKNKINQEALCSEWLEIKRVSIKYSTYVKYQTIMTSYVMPFMQENDICSLNELVIANYIFSLFEQKQLSASLIQSIRYVLKSVYLYAEQKFHLKIINFNYVRVPTQKTVSKTLTEKEEAALFRYCQNDISPASLAIYLGLYAGLRLGEACALQGQDIDLKQGIITISKTAQRIRTGKESGAKTSIMISNPKSHSSSRQVVIPDFLVEYLEAYFNMTQVFQENPQAFLLTGSDAAPEPRTIQRRFGRICQKHGFTTNFHTLRHTYATNCIKLGIDVKTVSEMLGHSNIATTLNRYVHPSLEFKKSQINKFQKNHENDCFSQQLK